MVTTLSPMAITLGAAATVLLLFIAFWDFVNRLTTSKIEQFGLQIDRAGLTIKPEETALTIAGTAVILWIALVTLVKPPLAVATLLLPALFALTLLGFYGILHWKIRRRWTLFMNQLELALRMISGGLRVGLGLRQALVIVVQELKEPSRHEYMRVLGQTNIGVSIFDALDDLAERMPANETSMMARVIRIQSQTGGNLGEILEQLAATIRERRQVERKIQVVTAEGRTSAAILVALPLLLGLFITVTQAKMGHALLYTQIGHITLFIVFALEVVGLMAILRVLKVNF